MKRFNRYICLGILLVFSGFCLLGALELELTAGVNQMTFQPSGPPGGLYFSEFTPYPFIIGSFNLKNEISGSMSYKISLERDNILQNSLDFRFMARTDFFRVEFGPFIGVNDDFWQKPDVPEIGVLGSMEFSMPGIFFFSISVSATLGTKYDLLSNNFRETSGAKIGFWLPYVLTTFSVNTKSYTTEHSGERLLRCEASAEIYHKNFPVIFSVNGGYQMLSRITDISEDLTSFFAGFGINIRLAPSFRILAGAEIPFLLKSDTMIVPGDFWKMFKAYAGVSYTFF
ncbi:MAG: hypothetical protein FWD26_01690 [Treponema sp.]|nr:hypothetical protein [Treponema sp.]